MAFGWREERGKERRGADNDVMAAAMVWYSQDGKDGLDRIAMGKEDNSYVGSNDACLLACLPAFCSINIHGALLVPLGCTTHLFLGRICQNRKFDTSLHFPLLSLMS